MTCFRKLIMLTLVLLLAQPIASRVIASSQGSKAAVDSVPSFAEPALSPDRSEIAFVSGGDIWTVPAEGGEARLLVSHPANESRPLYSPDGLKLAFISNRTGAGDIYVLTHRAVRTNIRVIHRAECIFCGFGLSPSRTSL